MGMVKQSLPRRAFLRQMAVGAGFLMAHDALVNAAGPSAQPRAGTGDPLICKIRLLTAAPLDSMRRFYRDGLGFEVVEDAAERITFAAGLTRLTFERAKAEAGEPFYHFAFNIPQNKLLAAREWQLARTPLVPTPPHLRDAAYPDDVRHFRTWHSHSVFFFDPALNIVEYIARHDLKNDAPGPFTTADILYASEIGYIVEQQAAAAKRVHEKLGLEAYPRGTEDWWAMGDEHGLVLCLPKGRLFGEGTKTPKRFDVFPTWASIRGAAPMLHEFEGLPYQVSVE